MKLKFLLPCVFFLLQCGLYAQTNFEGDVLDETGQPLTGATILEKGSSNGSITDVNGHFTIRTSSPTPVLVVSFIGYESQEVNVQKGDVIRLQMKLNISSLDQIVVLGYSSKKKNEIASAVTVVSEKQLRDATTNDIGTLLQGKVPGVQVVNSSGVPGAQAEIRIRGIASVSAPQGPLFVVDGIVGGNFDLNDVESVTVLRDAGATGMYGSQANGGVIVITTKKGKQGKPRFEARVSTGQRAPDFGNIYMMNGKQLYETHRNLYRNLQFNKVDFLAFEAERPRELSYRNFDWVNEVFQPAAVNNYYLSASGATDRFSYHVGGSYFDEGGTFKNTGFDRINFRANTEYKFSSKVSFTNNINISGAEGTSYDYNDMYYTYLSMPWDNPYDEDGNVRYIDGNTEGWWSRDKINPLHTLENSNHAYRGFDINYDLGLRINITDWLAITSMNRLAAGTNKSENFWSPLVAGAYHGKGFVNAQSDLSYGGVTTNLARVNFEGNRHSFSALAGYEGQGSDYEFIYAEGKGLPEGFDVLTVASSEKLISGSNSRTRSNSFISQANYNFRNTYFLTASYRIDAVSSFPPADRTAHFPSVSAGWLLSNEGFLQNNKTFNLLKLRVSYGITGMQDIGPYRYLGLFALNTNYNNQVGATPLQLPNDKLTWEKNNQLNFGIDIGLWKRFDLSVDIYQNTTKDLLVEVGQPLSVGFETRWENIGEVKNNGVEVALNTSIIQTRDIGWDISLSVGKNRNEISGLKAPIVVTGSWGISQIYRNGGELYTFYLKKWTGVDPATGLPTWEKTEDADGNPITPVPTTEYSQASNQEVGSALPDWQGGGATAFRWKGLTLSAAAAFSQGNLVYNNTRRFMDNDGHEPYYNLMVLREDENRWAEPDDIATHPNMANSPLSTETSSRLLVDGSFLKIRNIRLAYELPGSWLGKCNLESITVAISADNPFTFTNYWGQDPEATITPAPFTLPGVSDFKYPNNKQISAQLSVRF
jgi:TonB-linked SusC/RagA family outer membrane protein